MNDEELAAALGDAEKRRNGPVPDDPAAALEQLAEMLHLPSVDVRIVSIRMFGQGATASLDVELDNGETMRFDSLWDMVRPQTLMCELVACTGATPALKQPQAMRAVALARSIAGRLQTATEDDIAIDWACSTCREPNTSTSTCTTKPGATRRSSVSTSATLGCTPVRPNCRSRRRASYCGT